MAAKPKLTAEQWAEVRTRWETDARKGFPWLIDELSLPVSAEAIRLRSKSESWEKGKGSNGAGKKAAAGKKAKPVAKLAGKSKLGGLKESKLGDSESEKNAVGRPTLYRDEYAEQAKGACLMGADDAKLAELFDVTEQTINNWKHDHPVFFESLKEGKEVADANVASALYMRAVGCSHPDVHVSNFQGSITVTPITKHYPPETAAGIFWLKNRQPKLWKDRVEIKEEINLNVFPPREVLQELYDASLKRSTEKAAILAGRRERLGIVIDQQDQDGD